MSAREQSFVEHFDRVCALLDRAAAKPDLDPGQLTAALDDASRLVESMRDHSVSRTPRTSIQVHRAAARALESQQALTEIIAGELQRVGHELAQLDAGRSATARYDERRTLAVRGRIDRSA